MRLFTILLFLISINASAQKGVKITRKGWLVYEQDYLLAFFPIKDQSKMPTYENFLVEEKGDGVRMNNNYSAPPKLLIAKKLKLPVYNDNYNTGKDSLPDIHEFYIQPVKYVYIVNDILSDTTNYEFGAGGWMFPVNGTPTLHWAYHFMGRSGQIFYLTRKDFLFAKLGGRRKSISIYPPH